jgi:hypothetical protein
MIDYRELAWWYWLVIACLLTAAMAGHPIAYGIAVGTAALQILHFAFRERNIAAFPVQVRIAYLAMLIAGLWEPLQWIHWLQLAGTTARVLIGYCLLARTLSLAPWNRWQPLSFALIKRTFLSLQAGVPPCGEVFHRMSLERVQG